MKNEKVELQILIDALTNSERVVAGFREGMQTLSDEREACIRLALTIAKRMHDDDKKTKHFLEGIAFALTNWENPDALKDFLFTTQNAIGEKL